jgi:putative addiction module killer protein
MIRNEKILSERILGVQRFLHGQHHTSPFGRLLLRFKKGNLRDHKTVGGGVWEARLDFGPGYRLYFGKEGAAVILLLVGGDKSSQSKDIAAAKRYWADFSEATHGKAK